MLRNIAIGAILIFITTVVHAGGMFLALRPIRGLSAAYYWLFAQNLMESRQAGDQG